MKRKLIINFIILSSLIFTFSDLQAKTFTNYSIQSSITVLGPESFINIELLKNYSDSTFSLVNYPEIVPLRLVSASPVVYFFPSGNISVDASQPYFINLPSVRQSIKFQSISAPIATLNVQNAVIANENYFPAERSLIWSPEFLYCLTGILAGYAFFNTIIKII